MQFLYTTRHLSSLVGLTLLARVSHLFILPPRQTVLSRSLSFYPFISRHQHLMTDVRSILYSSLLLLRDYPVTLSPHSWWGVKVTAIDPRPWTCRDRYPAGHTSCDEDGNWTNITQLMQQSTCNSSTSYVCVCTSVFVFLQNTLALCLLSPCTLSWSQFVK